MHSLLFRCYTRLPAAPSPPLRVQAPPVCAAISVPLTNTDPTLGRPSMLRHDVLSGLFSLAQPTDKSFVGNGNIRCRVSFRAFPPFCSMFSGTVRFRIPLEFANFYADVSSLSSADTEKRRRRIEMYATAIPSRLGRNVERNENALFSNLIGYAKFARL